MRTSEVAAQLGFSLDDVEVLSHVADGGPESCDAARELATEKISDLDRRIARLQRMRAGLTRLVQTCEQPRHRRDCPLLAEIGHDTEEGA